MQNSVIASPALACTFQHTPIPTPILQQPPPSGPLGLSLTTATFPSLSTYLQNRWHWWSQAVLICESQLVPSLCYGLDKARPAKLVLKIANVTWKMGVLQEQRDSCGLQSHEGITGEFLVQCVPSLCIHPLLYPAWSVAWPSLHRRCSRHQHHTLRWPELWATLSVFPLSYTVSAILL